MDLGFKMSCYHPMKVHRGYSCGEKSRIYFGGPDHKDLRSYNRVEELILPCGQCVGCRMDHARNWAIRCSHEASLYDKNSFVTLTIDDSNMDVNRSLVKRDFVLFMKRLRFEKGPGIRFFHVGEYGDKFQRPHHHALLFNCGFDDKYFFMMSNGLPLYRSDTLERLWTKGFSSIGSVNFSSAGYLARYSLKKDLRTYKRLFNEDFGVWHESASDVTKRDYGHRVPDYITMSNKPGIGRAWFEKFSSDIYPKDFVVLPSGVKCAPPSYYDKLLKLIDEDFYVTLKEERQERAFVDLDNSPDRLKTREFVHFARLRKLNLDI